MPSHAMVPNPDPQQFGRSEFLQRESERVHPITQEPANSPVPDGNIQKLQRIDENQRSVPTFIVDRSMLFRAGLVHILADTRFRVVAECSRISEIPEKLLNFRKALLILGLDKDEIATLEQVLLLVEAHRGLRVVVLSEHFSPAEALSAVRSGGNSYLVKDEISPEVVLKSLELTLLGAVVVSRGFVDGMMNGRAVLAPDAADCEKAATESAAVPTVDPQHRATGLSCRERVILSHLMQGAANKQIARELGIAEATVKVHVKSLLRKVGVRNRTQAAMWGINNLEPEAVEQPDC